MNKKLSKPFLRVSCVFYLPFMNKTAEETEILQVNTSYVRYLYCLYLIKTSKSAQLNKITNLLAAHIKKTKTSINSSHSAL